MGLLLEGGEAEMGREGEKERGNRLVAVSGLVDDVGLFLDLDDETLLDVVEDGGVFLRGDEREGKSLCSEATSATDLLIVIHHDHVNTLPTKKKRKKEERNKRGGGIGRGLWACQS